MPVTLYLTHGPGTTITSTIRPNVPEANVHTVRAELLVIAEQRAKQFGTRPDSYRIVTRQGESTAPPTTDLLTAVTRLIALIEARPHQRGGRRMVAQAVYGDLWTPDRVGDVPADDRPALRALVSQIVQRTFPRGVYSTWVTADEVRTMYGLPAASPAV
jgi:hypothetical protein